MNIWALPKVAELRLVLLTLDQQVGLGGLFLDDKGEQNRRALRLNDPAIPGLSAYLYTYGQPDQRYGLELH